MSVMYKFSKRITLIKVVDIWTAKQWVQAFLKNLNLIDRGLPGKLMTNRDSKFPSKFQTILFNKPGVKLLYSTAYYPETDGSSKHTNQTIEITSQFFLHAFNDLILWPKIFSQIQSIFYNTFCLTINKIPNKIAYGFFLQRPLDLPRLSKLLIAFQTCADTANAISFTLANQKAHHNKKHQILFLKIEDQATLRLHKSYFILSSLGVMKKLTQ